MVQIKEDNPSIQELVIQDKMLNEAIQGNTGVMSGEVCIFVIFYMFVACFFLYVIVLLMCCSIHF
jgi:hypothetical protein